jgi:rRNA maturation endonuclease Nob1
MRAKVLRFNSAAPEDLETSLNAWLEEAGDIVIEESSIALANVALPVSTLVVFYRERAGTKAKPVKLCTQCRKKPPLADLKVCEACRDYQADYRKKRKAESKVRYP